MSFHAEVLEREWREVWPHVQDQHRRALRCRWHIMRETLPLIPQVDIDTVAQYYLVGTGQENWDLIRDFDDLRIPESLWSQKVRQVWMEYGPATHVFSDEHGVTEFGSNPGPSHVGAIITMHDGSASDQDGKTHVCHILDSYFWFKAEVTGVINAPFFNERIGVNLDDGKAMDERGPLEMVATENQSLIRLAKGMALLLRPFYLALSYLNTGKVRLEPAGEKRWECQWA